MGRKKKSGLCSDRSLCRQPDLNRHGFPLDFESSASAIPPWRPAENSGIKLAYFGIFCKYSGRRWDELSRGEKVHV